MSLYAPRAPSESTKSSRGPRAEGSGEFIVTCLRLLDLLLSLSSRVRGTLALLAAIALTTKAIDSLKPSTYSG